MHTWVQFYFLHQDSSKTFDFFLVGHNCQIPCHRATMSYAMPLLLSDIPSDKILLPDYQLSDLQALVTFIYSGGGWWEAPLCNLLENNLLLRIEGPEATLDRVKSAITAMGLPKTHLQVVPQQEEQQAPQLDHQRWGISTSS